MSRRKNTGKPDPGSIRNASNPPVETLCIHSYKALEHLTWYGSADYFRKYQSNGIMEIAAAHKKYFNRKISKTGIDRTPKANLGIVYKLAGKFDDHYFNNKVSLPSNSAVLKGIEPKIKAMAYVIMDSSRERYLTFLLPCLGILTKPEREIKGFYPFITKAENEYDRFLSFEQSALHEMCYEMHRLVENRSCE